MCLAIPMKVLEVKGEEGDFLNPPLAVVEASGLKKEVRLDIVDRFPSEGDFLIVHAGFAIHTLSEAEAEESLKALKEMAKGV